MKVTVRTLKGGNKVVDCEPTDTVPALKQRLEELLGPEYAADGLKLIYSGKILSDDKTLGDFEVKDGTFLVAMPGKGKPGGAAAGAAAAPAPAAAAVPATPAAAPVSTPAAPARAAGVPAASPAVGGSPAVASDAPTMNPPEEVVEQIVGMGFARDNVLAALRAAFGNRDRAVEYLFNGVPGDAGAGAPAAAAAPAPAAPAAAAAAPAPAATGAAPAAAAAATGGAPARGGLPPLGANSPLAGLASSPQFLQMRAIVQRRPELLPAILQRLAEEQPELVQAINENQEDFYILLNSTTGAGGAPPGAVRIQITQEESDAIDRLCALGFDRDRVIEAYLACDKNENLAANYLFQDDA